MPIIQEEKFKRKDEKKTGEKISLNMNQEELALIRKSQSILRQPKRSTALKQLVYIGANVVFSDKMGDVLKIVLDNERKNARLGIIDVDGEIDAKVTANK